MTELLLAAIGLVTGALAAVAGVGGGVVFVPALVIVAGFGQHAAEGTSLAVILPTMVIAAWTHSRHGRVVWPVAGRVGLFGIAGGLFGAWLALRLDEALLQRMFAILLVVVAIRMLLGTNNTAPED
jgi:uncharacterized membrane protein YfcA